MTSTLSSTAVPLLGSQEPSARVCPKYTETDGGDAARVLAAGGFILDGWQEDIMDDWMARAPSDRWACPTCGLSVPRQNGKTALVAGRIESGMLLFREQVLYTAHLQKTATETFEEIASFFDQPKMRKHLKDIKTALGREQVILKNGARVKFLARTRNGGRGQHGDLWLVDEAQCLDADGQASFLPAISASINPQAIYVGTPPDPNEPSDVFRRMREDALSGNTRRMSWTEYSVDEIGNVSDQSRWYATNPALGRRIQLATIEGEVEQMPPDTFARERLGWWSPVDVGNDAPIIPEAKWDALATDNPPEDGKKAFGVRFSPDGSEAFLAAALLSADGTVHAEMVRRESMSAGTSWLAEFIAARSGEASVCVIDGKSGVQGLVDRLGRMPKGYIHVCSAADATSAATTLADCVNEKTLTWYAPQADLRDSATTSIRRSIGNGGSWGFGGANPEPITAAALAVWGVKTARRDPRRRGLVG